MQFRTTAGEIIYTILTGELPGICGVINAFAGKDEAAIQGEFPQLEAEMCISGLGSMDFDGVFTLDPDFLQAITKCSRCRHILSIPSRRDQILRELTVFFCETEVLALEQVQDQEYVLHTACDPERLAAAFLQLPETTTFSDGCNVDSRLIQRKDTPEMIRSGCTPELAKLVVDAAAGIAGYAQLVEIENGMANDIQTVLYDEQGIVLVEVVYTWEQEQMRLSPIHASWLSDRIRSFAEGRGG